MDHVYINEPEKLGNDLNSLISKIFTNIKLIITDKDKRVYDTKRHKQDSVLSYHTGASEIQGPILDMWAFLK